MKLCKQEYMAQQNIRLQNDKDNHDDENDDCGSGV